jgi:hemerythrin-like domain-containing protein
MCDHCGCRQLTPVARLMDEHDDLRELTAHIRAHLAVADEAGARAGIDALLLILGPHVAREEGALFPLLRRDGSFAAHVAVLEREHAGLFDAVDDLDDVPPAAGPPWRDGVLHMLHELGEHMFKEDFGLFPAALATLEGSDWDAVDRWEEVGTLDLPQQGR